jgi:hypothetical protein
MLVPMTAIAPSGGLLKPPSERPAGKRGPRGPIAAIVALGALIPLAFARFADETSWARPVMLAAIAALICGALLLWTARRSVMLVAAVALVALGGAGAVVSIRGELRAESERLNAEDRLGGAVFEDPGVHGPRLTRAEAEAVPMGLTRQQLRSRLGAPPSHGIQRVNEGADMRCWAYRAATRHRLHAFCFRDGRYAELTEW